MNTASDREAAKRAIKGKSESDPDLDEALTTAEKLQVAIKREENRHKEKLDANDLGVLGIVFGRKGAASSMAGLAVIGGLAFAIGSAFALGQGGAVETWQPNIERGIAFACAALAFLFGRTSKS